LVLQADLDSEALPLVLPYLDRVEAGLVKSSANVVARLWHQLEGRGRHALIDRREHALALSPALAAKAEQSAATAAPATARFRAAVPEDLEALVEAARASLREEGRPDPFDGDPNNFRRWVRGRLVRARVVEVEGRVAFVAYADVRRAEGWLVQGVYTWPEFRRRGLASLGMTEVVREAFAAGADHVQLAVIEDNEAALALYGRLGFEAFDLLRTILFT